MLSVCCSQAFTPPAPSSSGVQTNGRPDLGPAIYLGCDPGREVSLIHNLEAIINERAIVRLGRDLECEARIATLVQSECWTNTNSMSSPPQHEGEATVGLGRTQKPLAVAWNCPEGIGAIPLSPGAWDLIQLREVSLPWALSRLSAPLGQRVAKGGRHGLWG